MRFILLLLALSIFTGCATLTPQDQFIPTHEQTRQNGLLAEWKLSGRFGARHGEEAWNGSLRWQQQGEHYQINLSGPLGSAAIQIQGDEQSSLLQVSEEEIYTATDAESLLFQHTGWQLPVSGLRYWLLGVPSPELNDSQLQLDEQGRLQQLTQQGWQIRYRRYTQVGERFLPSKVFLQNPSFEVRLIVDRWDVNG